MKRPAFNYFLLVSFLGLAIAAHTMPYFGFDLPISHFIQSLSSSNLTKFMQLVSLIGNMTFMPILIVITFSFLYILKLKTEALISLIAILSSLFVNGVMKFLVNRPRPTASLVEIYSNLTDKSFPSGHTMTYTVIFGFLLYLTLTKNKNKIQKKILAILFSLPILLVGVSRIYLGAHWPSDVLGGYMFGTVWLYIVINYYRRIQAVQS